MSFLNKIGGSSKSYSITLPGVSSFHLHKQQTHQQHETAGVASNQPSGTVNAYAATQQPPAYYNNGAATAATQPAPLQKPFTPAPTAVTPAPSHPAKATGYAPAPPSQQPPSTLPAYDAGYNGTIPAGTAKSAVTPAPSSEKATVAAVSGGAVASTSAPSLPSPPTHPSSPPPETPQLQSSTAPTASVADSDPSRRVETLPGSCLNDFHLSRTLGTGSFGRVHLVQHKQTGAYYAMKVLKKSEVVRLKQVEHIVNEKSILERTRHPFLVNLLATFQDSVNLYMIMEYVVGGEMFTYLRKFQRFPNHVAKFYAAQVVLAFDYLHSMDVIYRDLKPENLLLSGDGNIKITDFGFAKHVPDVTWTLCGTPDYLAPEIIQSKGYGKAVDWYSLGILIFEMLAGYPPFYDEDHFKLYEKILFGKIKWPPHIDPLAKDLIKRLLAADLSKRYGNLRGGVDDIKRHRWFMEIDWERLKRSEVKAPIMPVVKGAGDTSNFDQYPESNEEYGRVCHDPFEPLFVGF